MRAHLNYTRDNPGPMSLAAWKAGLEIAAPLIAEAVKERIADAIVCGADAWAESSRDNRNQIAATLNSTAARIRALDITGEK